MHELVRNHLATVHWHRRRLIPFLNSLRFVPAGGALCPIIAAYALPRVSSELALLPQLNAYALPESSTPGFTLHQLVANFGRTGDNYTSDISRTPKSTPKTLPPADLSEI
jgi:hypothetical protein